jgi:nicotinamidase-related amidase
MLEMCVLARRYAANRTGLLLIDAFNDFLGDGGKLRPRLQPLGGAAADLLTHMRVLLDTARRTGVTVLHVPHRRWREGDFDRWRHPTPWQLEIDREGLFACGTWGGDWHPDLSPQPGDVVVQEHWGQNGFFNTDLDLQLRQRGIENIILVGMASNTCVASTARFGTELGYHVTLVHDATAALGHAGPRAAYDIDGPGFAHVVAATDELVAVLGAVPP